MILRCNIARTRLNVTLYVHCLSYWPCVPLLDSCTVEYETVLSFPWKSNFCEGEESTRAAAGEQVYSVGRTSRSESTTGRENCWRHGQAHSPEDCCRWEIRRIWSHTSVPTFRRNQLHPTSVTVIIYSAVSLKNINTCYNQTTNQQANLLYRFPLLFRRIYGPKYEDGGMEN